MLTRALTPHGKFYGWDNDFVSRSILKGEFWEVYFKPWLDVVPVEKSVVDVGAHIGFFTVYLGLKGHDVYAFEPNPEVFEVLRMNVEANELQNKVTLYNGALYDKEDVELQVCMDWTEFPRRADGRMDMNAKSNSGNFVLVNTDKEKKLEGYQLLTKTVDSFGFENVGLIKVDTEGCDLKILNGSIQTIRRCRPVICFECVPSILYLRGDTIADYEAFVDKIGYQLTLAFDAPGSYRDYVAVPK